MRRSERAALAAIGCVLCLGAAILAPRTARAGAFSAEQPAVETLAPATLRTAEAAALPLEVSRDPFISQAPDESAAAAKATPPPFAAGGATAQPSSSPPALRAIVAGTHPYALVEVDGSVRIVAPGDRLGGSRVVAIDIDGLLLEGGMRMTLGSPAR